MAARGSLAVVLAARGVGGEQGVDRRDDRAAAYVQIGADR